MADTTNAVDFGNPDSIAAELAAAEAAQAGKSEKKASEPKAPKPKVIKVKFVAPKDIAAGETFEFDYEVPKSDIIRGVVAGIAISDMTDDQLKIEHRNAHSVFYKQGKAKGKATPEATARLEAVKAEMDKRGIAPSARAAAPLDAAAIAELIKSGKISIEDLQAQLDAVMAGTPTDVQ